MQTLQTIKTLLARLSGAPLSVLQASRHRPPPSRGPSRDPSGLYDAPPIVPSRRRTETSKQRDGDEGEAFARRWLEASGLVFVAANVSYRDGELDLVMRDPGSPARGRPDVAVLESDTRHAGTASRGGPTLVFVEVRRRARGSHGGAAGSITGEKRRRIVAAAAHYLVGLGLRSLPPCRFDVVTLDGDRAQGFRVDWIRDAFRDEG